MFMTKSHGCMTVASSTHAIFDSVLLKRLPFKNFSIVNL